MIVCGSGELPCDPPRIAGQAWEATGKETTLGSRCSRHRTQVVTRLLSDAGLLDHSRRLYP
jgi:hypothetical protein